ncbi:hypothetical protein JNB62_11495 [Microbacterium jejuense]|uniref:Uncharacterized protein n=1 Tax=Microbacterium jejuense TaxID=1263637 RepID=A0ABS7HMW0_9MICO|nr:hypothetical protein [Microbacterium jejuense]MBW9094309.1 hypothetical protein [Microbacterium jejuense]
MNDTTFFASTLHTHRTAELRREAEIREQRAAQAEETAPATAPAGHGFAARHRHTRRSAVAAAR